MSSDIREQMERARDLIKAKRYDRARDILESLDHPLAQQWLAKLDELDSPFDDVPSKKARKKERKERSGPGCLSIGLGIGCVAPIAFVIGVIAIIVIVLALVAQGQETATEEAVAANNDRGTLDKPIAAGDWMTFDDGKVRATRLVRPADAQIEEMNRFNDAPSEGAEYVLVWFELTCLQPECSASWNISLWLVDTDGKEWNEATFMVLDDDFDGQNAVEGGTIAGWQVFEIAKGKPIKALKVQFESVPLYVEPPAAS